MVKRKTRSAKRKPRSPKHPVMGLQKAIERVSDLYREELTATVPREVAVKIWGYSILSGPALQTISTLIQYGLVENIGGKSVKVSELAMDILIPKTSDAKMSAIQIAARNPSIFTELIRTYPQDIPSNNTLMAYLLRREPTPFNEKAAAKVIKAFRDTLQLANLKQTMYNGIDEEQITENNTGREAMIQEATSPQSGFAPQKQRLGTTWSFPITGRIATLNIPGDDPKQEEIDLIIGILNAFKPSLEKTNEI